MRGGFFVVSVTAALTAFACDGPPELEAERHEFVPEKQNSREIPPDVWSPLSTKKFVVESSATLEEAALVIAELSRVGANGLQHKERAPVGIGVKTGEQPIAIGMYCRTGVSPLKSNLPFSADESFDCFEETSPLGRGGWIATCSAAVVGPQTVVTAKHCLDKCGDRSNVVFSFGDDGSGVWKNECSIDGEEFRDWVVLRLRPPKEGEVLRKGLVPKYDRPEGDVDGFIQHYPLGRSLHEGTALVCGVESWEEESEGRESKPEVGGSRKSVVSIWNSSSGAPIVAKEEGGVELIGVNTGIYSSRKAPEECPTPLFEGVDCDCSEDCGFGELVLASEFWPAVSKAQSPACGRNN